MEFKDRLPSEGINSSQAHPLKDFAVLLAGVLVLALGLFWALSFALGVGIRFIPPKAEARLFRGFRDQLAEVFPNAEDPERQEQLSAQLGRLVASWPEAPFAFELALIEEDEPNAMALPGGAILLTTGLLEAVDSENGLAFVLAHELGHYAHRDHLRSLSRGLALGAVMALVTGSGSSAAGDVVRLSGEISNRRFSQSQESAADLFALELLHERYGHVGGATEFFECILETDGGSSAFLATHPAPQARIDRLREVIALHNWSVP